MFEFRIPENGIEIQIKKIHTKYGWKWRINEDTCLICQQEFDNTCQKCLHSIQCVPCIGMCSHIFHLHCIEEWLQNNKNCPMCRCLWEFRKIFKFDENSGM